MTVYVCEDKEKFVSFDLVKFASQVAAWGARELGIETPRIRWFFTHANPRLHRACQKSGAFSREFAKAPDGLFVDSYPGSIWLRSGLHAATRRRIVSVVLHELRHLAQDPRWGGNAFFDHEEDAYGWAHQAAARWEKHRKAGVQAELDRMGRRLNEIERDMSRGSPQERELAREREIERRRRQKAASEHPVSSGARFEAEQAGKDMPQAETQRQARVARWLWLNGAPGQHQVLSAQIRRQR